MGLKKGYYFFTLDAIIAIMVILIFIAVIPSLYFNKPQQDSLNYFSEDIIEVLSTLKVAESDNAYVRELISNGTITRLNNSILEQAGEFWALNEAGTAGILLSEVLGSLIPEGYNVEIVMEKDVISSSVEGNARNLVSAKRLISGIKEGEAVLGYTTRVFISGINDLSTSSYAFFGGYVGDGVITQRIQIPEVTSIEEGYLEINSGNNFDLYINEKFCDTFNKTSSDPLIAEKWYLNDSCLSTSYFQPGNNEIKFVFTDNISNFIGGGFIRVKYLSSNVNLTSSSSTIIDKEWIPGIQGVINLFSSFYVPGTLNDLKFYIHFMSNYSIFVNVGNTTVFESNGSSDNQTITLQNLSSVLDFTDLGGKTMPLKIGVSNMSLLSGFGGVSDAVLITDRTGSMSNCDVDSTSCIHPDCSSDAGCQNYRSDVAVDSDNVFIETILSVPGNNLGLIGFGERESPVCSIHDMGDDNLSLSSQVSDYNYGGEWQACGYTCISCGVVGATKLLMENQALYNLTRVSAVNTSYFQLGDGGAGVSVNETLEVDIDRSKFVKGRLTIFVKKVDTDDGHMDCVYLNDNYLGRACISNEVNSYGWQTCSYPLKPEWVNDGNNTVKITAGTVGTDCDATEGTNDEMYLKETRLTVWQLQEQRPDSISHFLGDTFYVVDSASRSQNTSSNVNIYLPELSADEPNPVDFTTGMNSTANTYGPNQGDDGWDWSILNGSGCYFNGATNGRLNITFNGFIAATDMGSNIYLPENLTDEPNPVDFTTGMNSTANTYGPNQGDDGWDWSALQGSCTFNGAVGGKLRAYKAADDGECSYGIQFYINSEQYTNISSGSKAVLSFNYEWDGNDDPFENGDQVWIKGNWTSPFSGNHMLGSNLDTGHTGSDDYVEIATKDNPDDDFSGLYSTDVSSWIEGQGWYYLEVSGKLLQSASDEWGYFRFDNFNLTVINSTDSNETAECSYGLQFYVTQDDYDNLSINGGNATLSFDYDWDDIAGDNFENTDQIWVKARWTSPTSGQHMIGSNLDSGEDTTVEVATRNNPDNDLSGGYSFDVTPWIEGPGWYYIETWGKLLRDDRDENGTLYFDNFNLTINTSAASDPLNFNLSIGDDFSKIKSSQLRFEAMNVNPSYYDCAFLNGEYLGRINYQEWSGVNTWQEIIFDVPTHYLNNGGNSLLFTGGTDDGCNRTSGTNDDWTFTNLNLSVLTSEESYTYDRVKSMLIMSDGEANTKIADCHNYGGSDCPTVAGTQTPSQETVSKACKAFQDHNIRIYAVAFGESGDVSTLNRSACCDDCSHFYMSNDADELAEIYRRIASDMLELTFETQQANITGTVSQSVLYSDSFIEYNYTSNLPSASFGNIPITFESARFNNNISNGSFEVPSGLNVLGAKVTSYSADSWTDFLQLNDNIIFNLSTFGDDYSSLGDPFIINIPVSSVVPGINTVTVSTGTSKENHTGGSLDDKVIYALGVNINVNYSAITGVANGCNWSLTLEDDSTKSMYVPLNYSGSNTCTYDCPTTSFSPSSASQDSINIAMDSLLRQLDFDCDGKLDVDFDASDLNLELIALPGVPFMWGPTVAEVRTWQ